MVSMRIARYILKAVEKVLHESLVYTLEQTGLQGNLQNIVTDFLCQKTVVLNGQHSSLTNVEGGVPMAWPQIQNYLRMATLFSLLFRI